MMHPIWIGLRLPFLTGSMTPVALAGLYAWRLDRFEALPLLLAAVGVACLHVAANLINDYYDAPGTDRINRRITPFSGGSRVIQEHGLSRNTVFRLSLAFFGTAVLMGILLGIWKGCGVLLVGLLGLLAGLLYSYQPVRLMSRGAGELTIFLAFGPFLTFGTFLAVTGALDAGAFLLGFPSGYLITAVIWINQFPDFEADRDTGKRNLVVRLGLDASRHVYAVLVLLPYPTVILFSFMERYTPWFLLALGAFPLSYKAIRLLGRTYRDHKGMAPVQALTIKAHLVTGLLMMAGLLADGLAAYVASLR